MPPAQPPWCEQEPAADQPSLHKRRLRELDDAIRELRVAQARGFVLVRQLLKQRQRLDPHTDSQKHTAQAEVATAHAAATHSNAQMRRRARRAAVQAAVRSAPEQQQQELQQELQEEEQEELQQRQEEEPLLQPLVVFDGSGGGDCRPGEPSAPPLPAAPT